MKTVVLTSSGLLKPEVRQAILPYLPRTAGIKVGYIPTASKVVKDDTYARHDVHIMQNELGFDISEIDLATTSPLDLPGLLSRQEIIYVQGGNGFYLLKHARRTGFMDLAKRLVENGSLIYIGKSAGSYLACPTIEMHTWHSNKWRRFGVHEYSAMNLVPFLVQAHYTEGDNDAILRGMAKSKYPLRLLTNEQALIVHGDEVLTVGTGNVCHFPFNSM